MTDLSSDLQALSQWDGEGGSDHVTGRFVPPACTCRPESVNPYATAEYTHLRGRLVALERLVMALLAQRSDGELRLARLAAADVLSRPGFTKHPVPLQAHRQIVHLLARSRHLRSLDSMGR